jgi:hypothetical protein
LIFKQQLIFIVPKNVKSSYAGLKNNKGKKSQSKPRAIETITSVNIEQHNNGLNNYASVAKFIQDTISIINDRATVIL